MFAGIELDPIKLRVVVLSVAGVGLIAGITAYYCQNSIKPQSANNPVVTQKDLSTGSAAQSTQTADSSGQGADLAVSPVLARITNIEMAPVDKPVSPKSKKHKMRAASRRQLSAVIPGLDVGKNPLDGPGGMVEMWSGNAKRVVTVPPGARYED
jgi:hypothetical protein